MVETVQDNIVFEVIRIEQDTLAQALLRVASLGYGVWANVPHVKPKWLARVVLAGASRNSLGRKSGDGGWRIVACEWRRRASGRSRH